MFLVAGLQGFSVLHLELFTPLLIIAQVAIGIDIAQCVLWGLDRLHEAGIYRGYL